MSPGSGYVEAVVAVGIAVVAGVGGLFVRIMSKVNRQGERLAALETNDARTMEMHELLVGKVGETLDEVRNVRNESTEQHERNSREVRDEIRGLREQGSEQRGRMFGKIDEVRDDIGELRAQVARIDERTIPRKE